MNWHELLDPAVCGRLCLTLLHSLWQVALLTLVARGVERLWRDRSVERCYAVYVTALLLAIVAIPVTYTMTDALTLFSEPTPAVAVAESTKVVLDDTDTDVANLPPMVVGSDTPIEMPSLGGPDGAPREARAATTATAATQRPFGTSARWLWLAPWIVGLYTVGVAAMLARLLLAIMRANRLAARANVVNEGPLVDMLASLARQWSMRGAPALALIEHSVVPKVTGLVRPMILLPASAVSGLSPDELELILTHELAHVRRHDMWVHLVQRLAEAALFFNPGLWYLSRRISTLREYCCDEMTCQTHAGVEGDEPRVRYATALLHVCELAQRPSSDLAALAASGRSPSEMRRRVARLFGEPVGEPLRVSRGGLFCVVVLVLALLIVPSIAQTRPDSSASESDASQVVESPDADAQGKAPADHIVIGGKCIVWEDKRPLANVEVRLLAIRGLVGMPKVVATTRSDAEGNFVFAPVEPPHEMRLTGLSYALLADIAGRPLRVTSVRGDRAFGEANIYLAEPEIMTLDGRVVDEQGKPVVGAKVEQGLLHRRSVPGIPAEVTDADGQFSVTRLPQVSRESSRRSIFFGVEHPQHPVTVFPVTKVPGSAEFVLPIGCTLSGLVRNTATDQPVSGVVISAIPMKAGGREVHAVTDAQGRYQMLVTEGNYAVVLEDNDVVANAVTDSKCRKGSTVRVSTLLASPGGWIAGQVTNTKTGEPVVFNTNGDRITVGVYGPARPERESHAANALAAVNDEGRFRIRAAGGENYPYFANIRGDRMMWDTHEQPAIIVSEGTTSQYDLTITPPPTADEKMAVARNVVDALPTERSARVAGIIAEFRKLNHTVDETETWCLLMRELVTIGSDAVPALCDEFVATDKPFMMRRLAFALRAIGDPRAVPTLIRVFPKTLQPPSSDYGLMVEDTDLAAFIREHSHGGNRGGFGTHFGLGRAVRETHAALTDLTDRDVNGSDLFGMMRRVDLRSRAPQQERYHQAAEDWAAWWEDEWQRFGVEASLAKVDLPPYHAPDLGNLPTGRQLTDSAEIDYSTMWLILTPVGDADEGASYFLDLDTGRRFHWPESLPREDDSAATVQSAKEWAAAEGADLMCVATRDDKGKVTYTLLGVGMQLWQVDSSEAEKLSEWVAKGKLPEGRQVKEALLHHDAATDQYKSKPGSCFIYVTRQQGLGMITVTDVVMQATGQTHGYGITPGLGRSRGVRFDYQTIARSSAASVDSPHVDAPKTSQSPALAERSIEAKQFHLTVIGPDGAPVPGASVELRTSPKPEADDIVIGEFDREATYGPFVRTDDEGRLAVVLRERPTRFNLSIKQPGFAPYWAGWNSSEHPQPIPDEFTAELDAGWSVGGVVVDDSGAPVEGVEVKPGVYFKKRPGDTQQLGVGTRIATDTDGRWRFDSVPASQSDVHVAFSHPLFRPLRTKLARGGYEVLADEPPAARIEMEQGLTIAGTVTDESGAPIVGALVRIKFLNDIREGATDTQGRYRLVGCEPRMARVVVSATGRATDMQEVRVDDDMSPVDFVMQPGGKIRIRVVDEEGNGIPKARIFFQRWRGDFDYFEFDHINQYADDDGVWEWDEAPLDEFQADVCRPGGMQLLSESLVAGDEEYVFTPPSALVVSGSVIDAVTRKPVERFRAVPGVRNQVNQLPGDNWIQSESYAATGGEYRLSQRRSAPAHLVRIEADGYQVAISRDIMTDEGEVSVDFELQPAEDITATILTAAGEPAAQAKIALGVAGSQINIKAGDIDDGSTYATRFDADAEGVFSVPARDEPIQLVITHPAGFAYVKSDDGPISEQIALTPWARVEGVFRVGNQPAANVTLSLFAEGFHSYGDDVPNIFTHHDVTTGADGRYAFERVMPGRGRIGRRILLMVNDGATEVTSSHRVATEFVAGETTTLDMGDTGRAVIGKLAPPAGFTDEVLWNFAMINVRADLGSPEPATAPDDVADDREKRRIWWDAWKATDQGQAWVAADKKYEQQRDVAPYLTASVDRDGSFRLDDMPAGEYVLGVRFNKRPPGSLRGHQFTVPESDGGAAPLDLGTLTLEQNASADSAASSSTPVDAQPATAVTDHGTTLNVAGGDDVVISGTVTDEKGGAVVGALVLLHLPLGYGDEWQVETTSDGEGRYTLNAPAARPQPNSVAASWVAWCYHADRLLAAAPAGRRMTRSSTEPIDFVLRPASDTGFVVRGRYAKRLGGALVEPWNFRLHEHDYRRVPPRLRKLIAVKADDQGEAVLPAMGRDRLGSVRVTAHDYGVQQMRLPTTADEPAMRNVQLRRAGRLEGRLLTDDPRAIKTATVFVEQHGPLGSDEAQGTAQLTVNANGRFVIPEFAEGDIELRIRVDPQLTIRPRIPEELVVRAGETTVIDIPFERTVRVRGRVQTKDSVLPVVDALVSVNYGTLRQSERVRTDADGRFVVNVLAGEIRQQIISRTTKFAHWRTDYSHWSNPATVPQGRHEFDLPPIELVETVKQSGRLIDHAGSPIAGAGVFATEENGRGTEAKTDVAGKFGLWLLPRVSVVKYSIRRDRLEPLVDATVRSESPLVLQLPLVPQLSD